MDGYLLLRFAHFVGLAFLGGGLLAVFVSELRAYRTDDLRVFAEAARYTALFYDALVVPGSLLLAASGLFLAIELSLGLFEAPWFVAMWGLFVLEFVEGNTITRIQFRRTLRKSVAALERGALTDELREAARTPLGQIAHFLDIPLLLVIVYCGAVRPASWSHVAVALGAAIGMAALLTLTVPRLARRRGRRMGKKTADRE